MQTVRRIALSAYFHTTRYLRSLVNAHDARCGRAPVCILFYHRVANCYPNTWTISNSLFEQELRWIQKRFDIISLSEAQQRIASHRNDRPAVAITFDDGYAENCALAIPLLVREQIPFTYFVCTRQIMTGEAFPHDLECGIPLRPNTPDQIAALADAGVEIGAHSRSHLNIAAIQSLAELRDETVIAARELEALTGKPIKYFSFPYGLPHNISHDAVTLLRKEGFAGVCSAYGDYNWPGDDPFHLKRIHGDPDMLRLANWLCVDPMKRAVGRATTQRLAPLFADEALTLKLTVPPTSQPQDAPGTVS